MLNSTRFPLLAVFAVLFAALGCHAQAAKTVPPEVAFRIEVLLRDHANLPPGSSINIGPLTPSPTPGFSTVFITFTNQGESSHPVEFALSDDYKTIEQIIKYDISRDTRTTLSVAGRPSRGGPETAPVLIVGFDDLECPYCARLHASIFPAITNRYGDKVHIVYKDFPLTEIHPWAKRAAIDVNCLALQSPIGYWNLVDSVHAHSSDIGLDPKDPKAEKTLPMAEKQLDQRTRDEGLAQKVDMTKLDACLAKQDPTAVDEMTALGTKLKLESTPTLYINGDKIDGAVPIEFIFQAIDSALRAQNVQPPPPYLPPTPAAATTPAPTPAPKPGDPSQLPASPRNP